MVGCYALLSDAEAVRRLNILGQITFEGTVRFLQERLGSRAFNRAVELGCGSGIGTLALAPLVGNVDAVDQSQDLIRQAHSLSMKAGLRNIRFITSSAEDFLRDARVPGQPKYDIVYL